MVQVSMKSRRKGNRESQSVNDFVRKKLIMYLNLELMRLDLRLWKVQPTPSERNENR